MIDVKDRCSTIDLRVDYLRPGRVNTPLVGEAEIIRIGNRVAVANVILFHDDARSHPVAAAKGVYSIKRASSS
jgi:acyl-coenzyme A thioesterase PaaI-like protein